MRLKITRFRFLIGILIAVLIFFGWQITHIDWQAYRSELADQFSDALGAEVELNGKLFISFFPYPTLATENVEILARGVEIHAPSVRLDAELWPLLRGRVILSTAEIDAPQIRLVPELWLPPRRRRPVDEGGRIHVQLQDVQMDDGTITLTLHGHTETFTDLSLDLSAADWHGPYHVEGDMDWQDLSLEFITSLGVQMPGGSRPLDFSIKESDTKTNYDWRGAFIAAPFALHGEWQGGDSAQTIADARAQKTYTDRCPKGTLVYLTSCFLFQNSVPQTAKENSSLLNDATHGVKNLIHKL